MSVAWVPELIEVYKNISTSPEENRAFSDLLKKKVNVFIQVMPQDKPVSVQEYLK